MNTATATTASQAPASLYQDIESELGAILSELSRATRCYLRRVARALFPPKPRRQLRGGW